MGKKPRVDRSPEEKWQIEQEGLKSGRGKFSVLELSRARKAGKGCPQRASHSRAI